MGQTIGKHKKPKFVPSQYQKAVFDWTDKHVGKGKHLVVEAVAGSGKTTTGVELFSRLPSGIETAFLAFNVHIAKELKTRLPEGTNARTYHSLGFQTLKSTFPRIEVNQDKVRDYVKSKVRDKGWLIPSISKLTSICKGGLQTEFTDEELEVKAFTYDVELFDEQNDWTKDTIFNLTRAALAFSIADTTQADFDDMIWLPNILQDHMGFFQLDFILVDEVQDTNLPQMVLATHSIKPNGTIIGVGDRKQSIYFFRGADETAMDRLKLMLEADELPLSLSYRCPTAIRDLVHREFPSIKFEVPEWAEPGKVSDLQQYDIASKLQPEDMVLCRVNADLITLCFSLIRNGVKATVRGRDIGKGLIALIKKAHTDDINDLFLWLDDWRAKEVSKAFALGAEGKIQFITDKYETIIALSDGASTVAEVLGRCETMFSDESNGVVLSTIHRAKGLEADRVFILRPDLLPHPAAKSEVELAQEANLKYVAITRAKKELAFLR